MPMSKEAKSAMANGRENARIIRTYLEGLRVGPLRDTTERNKAQLESRLLSVKAKLGQANLDILEELTLRNTKAIIEKELKALDKVQVPEPVDMEIAEKEFREVVKPYSDDKGITYAVWREMGVPGKLLVDAGFHGVGIFKGNYDKGPWGARAETSTNGSGSEGEA